MNRAAEYNYFPWHALHKLRFLWMVQQVKGWAKNKYGWPGYLIPTFSFVLPKSLLSKATKASQSVSFPSAMSTHSNSTKLTNKNTCVCQRRKISAWLKKVFGEPLIKLGVWLKKGIASPTFLALGWALATGSNTTDLVLICGQCGWRRCASGHRVLICGWEWWTSATLALDCGFRWGSIRMKEFDKAYPFGSGDG